MDPIIISVIALIVSILSFVYQTRELKLQRGELKIANDSNKISSKAHVDLSKIQAISTLLETEKHLHSWNNQQVKDLEKKGDESDAKQKRGFAKQNYERIQELKEDLSDCLNKISTEEKKTDQVSAA